MDKLILLEGFSGRKPCVKVSLPLHIITIPKELFFSFEEADGKNLTKSLHPSPAPVVKKENLGIAKGVCILSFYAGKMEKRRRRGNSREQRKSKEVNVIKIVPKWREEEWPCHYTLEKIQLLFTSIMYLTVIDILTCTFDLVSLLRKEERGLLTDL